MIQTWNGVQVERRPLDGFFNAAQLCRAGCLMDEQSSPSEKPKEFFEYQRRARGREYIEALTQELGGVSVVAVCRGTQAPGTWIHPRLAIDVARWLSPKFAVWVDGWVLTTLMSRPDGAQPALMPGRLFHHQKIILDEKQLHHAVVKWFRDRYPGMVIVAGLGENQDTEEKRLDSFAKGYTKGQPDLLVPVRTATKAGFALELKHPGKCTAQPSEAQSQVLKFFADQGWETMVSNDYDGVCSALSKHMDQRVHVCECCGRQYASPAGVERHRKRKGAPGDEDGSGAADRLSEKS